jgi:hypothetical protein
MSHLQLKLGADLIIRSALLLTVALAVVSRPQFHALPPLVQGVQSVAIACITGALAAAFCARIRRRSSLESLSLVGYLGFVLAEAIVVGYTVFSSHRPAIAAFALVLLISTFTFVLVLPSRSR